MDNPGGNCVLSRVGGGSVREFWMDTEKEEKATAEKGVPRACLVH